MVPFVTALVALDEDPAVRIVDVRRRRRPETLAADEPVEVDVPPAAFPTVPDRR